MTLGAARWHVIAESNFAWEREALDWLRSQLPDRDPWHVWTNFEFIDDEGKVSEVDALVLSPAGLFLVEIKSRPGVLTGDVHSWTWTTDGRSTTVDNPVILANRKAKRLASLLKRQPAITKAKIRLPFVEPAIFLSSTSLSCRLEGLAKSATFQRGRPGALDDPGIVGALANGVTNRSATTVDSQQARAIARGLTEAGIRPSNSTARWATTGWASCCPRVKGFRTGKRSTSASTRFIAVSASTPSLPPPPPRPVPHACARRAANSRSSKASTTPAS